MPLDPDESPGFLLWHVTLRWQRDIAVALAPLELTHVQFVLLATTWWLNTHGPDPNQLTLAQQAGADVKMTSQVLRRLEAKGLLTREVDPTDTRARRLRVTDRGAELAQRAVDVFGHVDPGGFTLDPAGTFGPTEALVTRLEADPRIHRVSLSTVVGTASPGHTGSWPLCHQTYLDPAYNPSGFCWDTTDDTTSGWIPQ